MNMSILIYLLTPISFLYSVLTKIRRFLYHVKFLKNYHFKVPIISVGNLSMGGTGKTPFTLWIGKYVESLNKKPMVVMRGYRGLLEHSSGYIASDRKIGATAKEFGDEAILYKKNLKDSSVLVGKNRAYNLLKYFKIENPDVVLLDDGFQHLQIAADLNILLFDATLPFSRYKVVPCGYLRESMSAIIDADVIILNRSELVGKKKIQDLTALIERYSKKVIPVLITKYKFTHICDIFNTKNVKIEDLKGKNVVAFAGIASPENFFENIKKSGANLVKTFAFDDHYTYREQDLLQIYGVAATSNSILLTTEKDIVKLDHLAPPEDLYYLKMELEFVSQEQEQQFINLLNSCIE